MNTETWRLLDTGLASAARNIALTRALLEARHADESPSTLRFLRFAPGALLGCSQSAREELDPDYCVAQRIALQRRVTSGTAWFVDERQLGWELYLHRREVGAEAMPDLSKRICHAAATALSALGIDARYRARDEIDIDGRVLSMTGTAAEGGGVLLQGVLLVEADLERTARVLRLPARQETAGNVDGARNALRTRFTDLREALGRQPDLRLVRRNLTEAFESEFDVRFREGDLTLTEHARYESALREVNTDGWIDLVSRPASAMPLLDAVHPIAGGVLRASLKLDTSSRAIRQIWFSGDIALNPRRSLNDLEATLRDVQTDRVARQIESFFRSRAVDCGALRPEDFIAVVRLAIGQPLAA